MDELNMYSNLYPKGKWFIKHLNWTVVLYWLLGFPLSWFFIFGLSMTTTDEDIVFGAWAILGIVWLTGLLYILVWNLKYKGRSLFNLFYLLIPFGIGFITFLCINNREQLAKEQLIKQEGNM